MMVADFVTRQQNGSPLNGEIPGQNHNSNSNMPAHSALLMSNNSNSNSNSSGRASPHTSSESEFPQNGYELAAHLKRKELFSQRKQREFIPDNKKDDSYWDRRRRNNEAAKRSREKRRFNDMVLEQRVVELTKENHVLKAQLDAIKSKYNICGENLVSVDQIMATLPTNEQVLSSTKRVKLSSGSSGGGRSTSPGGQSISMFPLSRSPSRQPTASPTQSCPLSPPAASASIPVGSSSSSTPHLQQSLLAVVTGGGLPSQTSPTPSSQQAPVIHANPNVESPPPSSQLAPGAGSNPPSSTSSSTSSAVHSSTGGGAIQHTNGSSYGNGALHAIYRTGAASIIEYERIGEATGKHHEPGSPPSINGRSPSQIRLELIERNLDDLHHQQQQQQQQQHHHLHHHLQQQQQHHPHHYSHHPREVIRESVIDHRGEHHVHHHQQQQQQQQQHQQQQQQQQPHIHQHHSNHHHRVLAANGGHELIVDDRDDRSPSPPHVAPASSSVVVPTRFGSPPTTTAASSSTTPPATSASASSLTIISSTSPSGVGASSPPAHIPLVAHSHHFAAAAAAAAHHPHHPHHPHALHHPHHLPPHHPHHHPHHPHHHVHPFVVGATSPYASSSPSSSAASSSASSSAAAAAAVVAGLPVTYSAAAAVAAYAATNALYASPPRTGGELSPNAALTLTANVLNLSRRAPSPYDSGSAASASGASPPRSSTASAGSASCGEEEPDRCDREIHEHANSLPVKLRHKSHLGDKDAATALLALQNIKQEPVGLRSASPSWDDGGDGSSDERDSGISTNEWPTKAEQKMMVPLPGSTSVTGSDGGSPVAGASGTITAAMMAAAAAAGKITSIPASVVISKKTEENIHLQSKLARLESEVATIKNMMISNTTGSAFGVTAAAQ